MKRILVTVFIMLVLFSSTLIYAEDNAQTNSTNNQLVEVQIPGNTEVIVKTTKDLTSTESQINQFIDLSVAKDIVINGHTVIKEGALAKGLMTSIKSSGAGVAGVITVAVMNVTAVDNQTIPVMGNYQAQGKNRTGAAFIPVGGLFVHGQEAVMSANTEIKVIILNGVTVKAL